VGVIDADVVSLDTGGGCGPARSPTSASARAKPWRFPVWPSPGRRRALCAHAADDDGKQHAEEPHRRRESSLDEVLRRFDDRGAQHRRRGARGVMPGDAVTLAARRGEGDVCRRGRR